MSKHHLLSPLLTSQCFHQPRELVGLMEFSHYETILKWGHYSSPHPILFVLKQFQIWMLQKILLFPCGIFTRYILPLHQVFFDCPAPQSSLPCLQNLFWNKCELYFIIQRREFIWNEKNWTTYFLRQETWNTLWILLPSGSSNSYATSPIFRITL